MPDLCSFNFSLCTSLHTETKTNEQQTIDDICIFAISIRFHPQPPSLLQTRFYGHKCGRQATLLPDAYTQFGYWATNFSVSTGVAVFWVTKHPWVHRCQTMKCIRATVRAFVFARGFARIPRYHANFCDRAARFTFQTGVRRALASAVGRSQTRFGIRTTILCGVAAIT